MTARARPYPQIPDAVRTQRGPAATLTDHTPGPRSGKVRLVQFKRLNPFAMLIWRISRTR
jgi:hypothetical protein